MNRCCNTHCGYLNRHAARFCARCGRALTAPGAAAAPLTPVLPRTWNPLLSTGAFFVATLLVTLGLIFVLTGGPMLLGLGLIVFSCVALSPREPG